MKKGITEVCFVPEMDAPLVNHKMHPTPGDYTVRCSEHAQSGETSDNFACSAFKDNPGISLDDNDDC